MAGNKNSGRKSIKQEYGLEKLKDRLVLKSYNNNLKALDSKKMTTKEKADLANKVVTKDMGSNVTLKGDKDNPIEFTIHHHIRERTTD